MSHRPQKAQRRHAQGEILVADERSEHEHRPEPCPRPAARGHVEELQHGEQREQDLQRVFQAHEDQPHGIEQEQQHYAEHGLDERARTARGRPQHQHRQSRDRDRRAERGEQVEDERDPLVPAPVGERREQEWPQDARGGRAVLAGIDAVVPRVQVGRETEVDVGVVEGVDQHAVIEREDGPQLEPGHEDECAHHHAGDVTSTSIGRRVERGHWASSGDGLGSGGTRTAACSGQGILARTRRASRTQSPPRPARSVGERDPQFALERDQLGPRR